MYELKAYYSLANTYYSFICHLSFKEFRGFLEKPWKVLKAFKHLTLASIFTSLEIFTLNLALKLEGFQGYPWNTLEISRVFKDSLEKPLKCFGYPWPWLTLEIQLQGRGTLKFKATIALTNQHYENGHFSTFIQICTKELTQPMSLLHHIVANLNIFPFSEVIIFKRW